MAAQNPTAACTVPCLLATALNTVEVKTRDLTALAPGHVRVKTEYSMVSTGTELHTIQGTHTRSKGQTFPRATGYIALGHVAELGDGVKDLALGDRVLFGAAHYAMIDVPADTCCRVPEGIASTDAVCTTLLCISIRGVRGGRVCLGKSVAVFGQGVIGLYATHLAKLAGACPVIGVDPVAARRDIARKMGADLVIDPMKENVLETIKAATGGRGADVAIESTATPRVVASLPELTALEGTIVILGGVHGKVEMDLYTYVQKSNQTIVGCGSAYHADYPFDSDAANRDALLHMIRAGMVRPGQAVTHRVPYTQAPAIYQMLMNEKDKAIGVQFDWTKSGC